MNNFWYDAIKRYYGLGCYTNENMRVFVKAERITKEQFKEITGKDFEGASLQGINDENKVM